MPVVVIRDVLNLRSMHCSKCSLFVSTGDLDRSIKDTNELRHAVDLILVCDIRKSQDFAEKGVQPRRIRGKENATVSDSQGGSAEPVDF